MSHMTEAPSTIWMKKTIFKLTYRVIFIFKHVKI